MATSTTNNALRTIKLAVRENKGQCEFKGNSYWRYTFNDSYGHYFTKLLKNDYPHGTEIEFAVQSYKGQISLKAIEKSF